MCFTKMCLERNPCFLDQRKAIPCLDIFLEFSILVDNIVGLQYHLSMRIETISHVTKFNKVFNFVGNIVDWSDQVIVYFCYFFLKLFI